MTFKPINGCHKSSYCVHEYYCWLRVKIWSFTPLSIEFCSSLCLFSTIFLGVHLGTYLSNVSTRASKMFTILFIAFLGVAMIDYVHILYFMNMNIQSDKICWPACSISVNCFNLALLPLSVCQFNCLFFDYFIIYTPESGGLGVIWDHWEAWSSSLSVST